LRSSSLIEQIRAQPDARRRFEKLSDAELHLLLYDWPTWARPEQLPPALSQSGGIWQTWLILAGRGFGKTRCGAEQVRHWVKDGFNHINFIAATADDLRDIMVEGESGILAICPSDERPEYMVSKRRLDWPNGSRSLLFTAQEPDRLRGKQHEKLWADEPAAWQYADDSWDQAMFGLRLGKLPQTVATTTPRPTELIRKILADPNTAITRGTTYANRTNLAPSFYSQIIKRYEGTRLGRQELMAEVLDDNPGALFKLSDIDQARLTRRREYKRIVIAIDPAVTSNPDSDETGIVVAGDFGGDPEHYDVLEDASGIFTPDEWAKRAVQLYYQYEADRIIGEANNGGDMIEAVLRHADPNVSYRKVTATRGKTLRAEPISALYEQLRVHHVGNLGALEDQQTNWNPQTDDKSPDRLDALVWAITELSGQAGEGFAGYYAAKAEKAVKSQKAQEESKVSTMKKQRKWSHQIQMMQLEIKPDAITAAQWADGFSDELGAWVEFCRENGGGDRLAFAEKELSKLGKKFGTLASEVPA
jgi:phage terminase large subunit-like protein